MNALVYYLSGIATVFVVIAILAALFHWWLGPAIDEYDRGHK